MGCVKSKIHHMVEGIDIPINEEPDGEHMALLPSRLREKIFRYLDQASKLVLREVCKTFKSEVDHGAGLSARINDYEEGNLKFIKTIEVTEGCILHISDSVFENRKPKNGRPPATSPVFRCHHNLQKLEVWGKVSYLIFSHVILKSSETLTSMTFKPLAFIHRYINPDPDHDAHPSSYDFPNLRALEIHYGFLDRPDQDFKIFNENMHFLLKTMHCPKIRTFNVIPEPNVLRRLLAGQKTIEHKNLRWENHTLKEFISEHRFSLRTIELGLYRSVNLHPTEYYKFPKYLSSYSVCAPCLEAVRVELVRDFFQEMLGCQTRLKNLSMQVEWFNNFLRAFMFLRKRLFVNNFETLTDVCIQSYHRKKPEELNIEQEYFVEFNVFTRLVHLKVLAVNVLHVNPSHLQTQRDQFTGLYFNEIPKSLREITVRGILLASDEMCQIANAGFLESVSLIDCGTTGSNGMNFDVARAFFTSKKIKYIRIRGLNDDVDPRSLYALLIKFNGKISEVIEMEYPAKKIGFIDKLPCCCCLRASGEENLHL